MRRKEVDLTSSTSAFPSGRWTAPAGREPAPRAHARPGSPRGPSAAHSAHRAPVRNRPVRPPSPLSSCPRPPDTPSPAPHSEAGSGCPTDRLEAAPCPPAPLRRVTSRTDHQGTRGPCAPAAATPLPGRAPRGRPTNVPATRNSRARDGPERSSLPGPSGGANGNARTSRVGGGPHVTDRPERGAAALAPAPTRRAAKRVRGGGPAPPPPSAPRRGGRRERGATAPPVR